MHRSALRRVLTSVLSMMLLSGLIEACDCGGAGIKKRECYQNDCCKTDQDCFDIKKNAGDPDPSNWACEVESQACRPLVVNCTLSTHGDTQCCPGQACSMITEEDGVCGDKMTSCEPGDPSACSVRGQYCEANLGSRDTKSPGCTFRTCNNDLDCADGLSCFNGSCVGEPPCRGGCPVGSVCTPVNNQCYRLQDNTANFAEKVHESCQQSCNAGYMLVFSNPKNIWGLCDQAAKECTCLALPPVHAYDTARFSSSVATPSGILVSAYDGDHGDLVLHTFSKGSDAEGPKLVKSEWIDGVPTSGAITGDPNGPRGGREAPGPDVGQYTSIAYDAASGAVHISYYAVKDGNTVLGNLKYARRVGDGPWTIFDVDGVSSGSDTGDVGLYSSITLSPDGAPVIAYFQRSGPTANPTQTAVKVARAKGAAPASASDWTISTIETGTRPADPNPLASLPDGNGLFSSLAYLDSKPVVVWYDNTNGVLKGVIATADSPAQGAAFRPSDIQILDNGKVGTTTHKVGQFTSIAIGPSNVTNRIAVSYMDATARQLRVLTAGDGWSGLTAPADRVVDTGIGDPAGDPLLFVGADSSVRFTAKGLSVVYQDSTGGDLRLAEQTNGAGPVTYKQTLARDGACGFYAKLVVDGSARYATHAIIKARQGNGAAVESANRLDVLKLP